MWIFTYYLISNENEIIWFGTMVNYTTYTIEQFKWNLNSMAGPCFVCRAGLSPDIAFR